MHISVIYKKTNYSIRFCKYFFNNQNILWILNNNYLKYSNYLYYVFRLFNFFKNGLVLISNTLKMILP